MSENNKFHKDVRETVKPLKNFHAETDHTALKGTSNNGTNGNNPIKNPANSGSEHKNENGDYKKLQQVNPRPQTQAPESSDNGISPSSAMKARRNKEESVVNATGFGGVPGGTGLPQESQPNETFASKTVRDRLRQKENEANANKNVVNYRVQAVKANPANALDIFVNKTEVIAQRVKEDALIAKDEIVETVTKAFTPETPELTFAEEQKLRKQQKAEEKDRKLLANDGWFNRNGHLFTYIGLFLFSAMVYFRPYEWVPGLENFTSIALVFAIITLIFYLPTQLATEGTLTIPTTEIKCALALVFLAIVTMPIAKDVGTAWKEFSETFVKIILVFVVMVNSLRTKERLKGLMWLSIGVGVMLSFQALQLYNEGKFEVEGYRVNPDFGGMFGNPNDTALHLVIFTPIAIVLGLTSKNIFGKVIYFGCATLMVMANFVMQSRGGFLGLIAISVFLVWKLSKNNRIPVITVAIIVGFLVITFAPGNYWIRILSIIDPSLDPVGSSDQRRELLERSIQVTLRNPLGIGIGCFPIVGVRNLQTHNAFTQVSSELGWLGLLAYVTFLVSPFRKLAAMERQMFANKENNWMYYLAIGLQASIIGYMVSSFFVSVAYQWFIYFPVAYAVCLRRIYKIQQDVKAGVDKESSSNQGVLGRTTGWFLENK